MFDVFCRASARSHVPGNLLYHTGDVIRREVRFLAPPREFNLKRSQIPANAKESMRLVLIAADVIVSEGAFVCVHAKAVAFACLYAAEAACVLASSLLKGPFKRNGASCRSWKQPTEFGEPTFLLINVLLGGISKGGETISQVV